MSVRQLWEDFSKYLYLPRLVESRILLQSIQSGAGQMLWRQESFAYAQRKDDTGRYHGLVAGENTSVSMDGIVVKSEIAQLQREIDEEERRRIREQGAGGPTGGGSTTYPLGGNGGETEPGPTIKETAPVLSRFHATATLDSVRLGRDAGQIAEAIIQHLSTLPGAQVEITLEIQARLPEGVPDHVLRTVTENANFLKLRHYEFEEE